ncbi:MAG: hypothetical protein LBF68_05755 [Christensenellaceae bacterium]|jgi:hypothetical protein|nr:hypothetical protein [Christensenellaceae bacterium]
MRKTWIANGFIWIFIVFVFCFLLDSCIYRYQVFDYIGVKYVKYADISGKIEFLIIERPSEGVGYITINGKHRKGIFGFSATKGLEFYISLFNEDPLLGIESNEMIYCTFENDIIKSNNENITLFGEEFDRLVFTRTPVDEKTIDASQYFYFEWKNSEDILYINFRDSFSLNGIGTAKTKTGEMANIVFVWRDDRKFEIYLEDEATVDHYPKVRGSYTNIKKELELTIEYNDDFFDDSIKTISMKGG